MLRIINKILSYGLVELFNKSLPFILLPVLTRYLTSDEYGYISSLQMLWQFLAISFTAGCTSILSVSYFRDNQKAFERKYNNIRSNSILLFLFSLFALFIYNSFFPLEKIIYLLILSSFFNALLSFKLAIFQAKKDVYSYAKIQFSLTILNLALSLSFVIYIQLGGTGRILGFLFPSLIIYFVFFRKISLSEIRNLAIDLNTIKDGLPLLLHQIANWSRYAIDKYIILLLLGTSALGNYNVNFQLAFILSILVSILNKAIQPFLFERLKENKNTLDVFLLQVFTSIISYLLTLLFIYFFADLIIGKNFEINYFIINILLVSFLVQGIYMSLANYFYFYKKHKTISMNSLICLIFMIACSAVSVSKYGEIGASVATLMSMLLLLILTIIGIAKNDYYPWVINK